MKKTSLLLLIVCFVICGKAQLTASFMVSDTLGCPPKTINLTNTSTGATTWASFFWDLGDGSFSAAEDVSHIYIMPGEFIVKLIVSNGTDTDSTSLPIKIGDIPQADFTANPLSGIVPLEVSFTNLSTSTDSITIYSWDFGDGSSSNDINPTHTYLSSGSPMVTLIVTTVAGCSDYHTYYITISDLAINENQNQDAYKISPNPAANHLVVETLKTEETEYELLDINGKLLMIGDFFQLHNRIDISDLPVGTYFINFNSKRGTITKQFIKI